MATAERSRSAFTLIELLVVITIIAILAGIGLPVFNTVQERARVTQDLSNLRQLGLATQTLMNDNDGIIFSTNASAGNWMAQLHPKYLPVWRVFESAFDRRTPTESDTAAPISYGLNGNTTVPNTSGTSIAGLSIDKVTKPSVFIIFAPAQASGTSVSFTGLPGSEVTVYKAGAASGGTNTNRSRICALFADLHTENMTWTTFINDQTSQTDQDAAYRWSP